MPNWIFNILVAVVVIVVLTTAMVLLALLDLPAWGVTLTSFSLVALLVALLIGWSSLMDAVRARRMRRLATAMCFEFAEVVSPDELASYSGLPLFRQGQSRFARNRLRGNTGGRRVVVIDLEYTTGVGRYSQHRRQTVVIFPDRHALRAAGKAVLEIESAEGLVAVYRRGWMQQAGRIPRFVQDALGVVNHGPTGRISPL